MLFCNLRLNWDEMASCSAKISVRLQKKKVAVLFIHLFIHSLSWLVEESPHDRCTVYYMKWCKVFQIIDCLNINIEPKKFIWLLIMSRTGRKIEILQQQLNDFCFIGRFFAAPDKWLLQLHIWHFASTRNYCYVYTILTGITAPVLVASDEDVQITELLSWVTIVLYHGSSSLPPKKCVLYKVTHSITCVLIKSTPRSKDNSTPGPHSF